jgi:hypothetical protein
MLKDLIKVANRLDNLGLQKEADIIDGFIQKMASDERSDFYSEMLSKLTDDQLSAIRSKVELMTESEAELPIMDEYGGGTYDSRFSYNIEDMYKKEILEITNEAGINRWNVDYLIEKLRQEYLDANRNFRW